MPAAAVAVSIRGLVHRHLVSIIALEYNKANIATRPGTAAKLHLTGLEFGLSDADMVRNKAK